MESYYNIVETVVCIFRVSGGNLQVLLKKKKSEPFKGCFLLPGNILPVNETLETNVKSVVYEATGEIIKKLYSSNIFSDLKRDPNERIIACSYIATVSKSRNVDMQWFDIKNLPALAFDHEKIITSVINSLKNKIMYNENKIVNDLFKGEFSLGDFQKFWESITGISYDRRNFRKKLITNGMVIESGNYNRLNSGRPSKLYSLSDKFEGYKII